MDQVLPVLTTPSFTVPITPPREATPRKYADHRDELGGTRRLLPPAESPPESARTPLTCSGQDSQLPPGRGTSYPTISEVCAILPGNLHAGRPRRSSMQRDAARVTQSQLPEPLPSGCLDRLPWPRLVRSFCTALKPPAPPTATRLPGGRAASGRSHPPPRLTAKRTCQRPLGQFRAPVFALPLPSSTSDGVVVIHPTPSSGWQTSPAHDLLQLGGCTGAALVDQSLFSPPC